MIKPADENSPFAGVKFDGTLKNEGGTIGFARIVSQEDYYRGYQEGHKEAEKTLRDEIAMRAMQGLINDLSQMDKYENDSCFRRLDSGSYIKSNGRYCVADEDDCEHERYEPVPNGLFIHLSQEAYQIADAMLKVRQGDG